MELCFELMDCLVGGTKSTQLAMPMRWKHCVFVAIIPKRFHKIMVVVQEDHTLNHIDSM
jgi:hypothetical protein